jgi:hypothetical protein
MKVGELVRVIGDLWSTYSRQDSTGIIVREASVEKGLLVLWEDGDISLFGRPDHLEVLSENR